MFLLITALVSLLLIGLPLCQYFLKYYFYMNLCLNILHKNANTQYNVNPIELGVKSGILIVLKYTFFYYPALKGGTGCCL